MKRIIPVLLVLATFASLNARAGAAGQTSGAKPFTSDTVRDFQLRNISPGISPARIADIAVDPKNASVWYIATAASGLWKTINRGHTWAPIFDDYNSYSLGCVVVDPKNSDVVWLGTGENQSLRSVSYGDGLYKSTDAGATWKRVGLEKSEHIAKILIDPRNSDVVYIAAQGPLWAPGGDRGLYKTTDGGQTWKPVLTITENTGITDAVFDPRNPDVIYAAAYQRRRHVGLLIGGGPDAGIFKTTDGGGSWKKLTNGIPTADLGRIALAVSPQKPDVVYAVITVAQQQSGFFKSEDSGQSWTRQRNYQWSDPQFYGEIYADPHAFDKVWSMDMRIQLTTDGGKTSAAQNWPIHVDNHAIWLDPSDSNHMLVGNDGGLYETYDNGRAWRPFNNICVQQWYGIATDNALPFYNIYGGAQDNGSIGGPSRTIYRAGIRNSDWKTVGGGDGMQPRVDPSDPTIMYVQSQNGALSRLDLKTGQSTGIRPRNDIQGVRWNWNTPLIVSPHASSRIYFAGSRIYRSDNRGTAWTVISPDLTRQIDRDTLPVMGRLWGSNAVTKNTYTTSLGVSTGLSESPRKEGLIYICTDDGLVQVTEDGGQNWRKIEKFPGVPDLTMASDVWASGIDENTVYATFNDYQRGNFKPYVLKSSNRGRDWVSITGNLPTDHPVWSIAEDHVNKDLLFVGTEFGLFASIDGGKQWAQFREGTPPAAFRDLEIQQRETDLVGGTFGRGFFILDDYTALRQMKPDTFAKEAALFGSRPARVYYEETLTRAVWGNVTQPNPPFGAGLTYYLRDNAASNNARVTLEVADAGGKTIRQVTGPATAGIHRVTWNLRGDVAATNVTGGDQEPIESNDEEEEEEAEQGSGEAQNQQAGRGTTNTAVTMEEGEEQPTGERAGARRGGGRAGGRGGGGRGGGEGGALVSPGKYKVTLGKMEGGKLVPLAEPQIIEVIPLNGGSK